MVEKTFWEKYRWVFGVSVFMVISMVLYIIFAINPTYESIKKTNSELKEEKANLETLRQKLDKLKKLKAIEDELREEAKLIDKAIPSDKALGNLFIQLESLVEETGGDLPGGFSESKSNKARSKTKQNTNILLQSDMGNVKSINVGFKTTFPSYKAYKKYLERSENTLRYMFLDNFDVTSSKGENFDVNLNYIIYYRDKTNEEE